MKMNWVNDLLEQRTMYHQQGLKKEMGYQLLRSIPYSESRCSLEWRHGDCISRTYEGNIDFNDKSIVLASRIIESGDTTYVDSMIIEGIVTINDEVDSTSLFEVVYDNGGFYE